MAKLQAAGAETGVYTQVDALRKRVKSLRQRNRDFIAKLRTEVLDQVKRMRAIVADEKRRLTRYEKQVEKVGKVANRTAESAVKLALGHVIDDFNKIIVRADIGLADTAFQRKQVHTAQISKLSQSKSEEMSNLNQIYLDLQADEVQ